MSENEKTIFESEERPNIVAVDVECVQNNGLGSKMGTIAFVKADHSLRVIEKKEQYLHYTGKICDRIDKFVKFDRTKLAAAPEYSRVYAGIKKRLTESNTIYLAHSCINDIGFISNENRNNNFPEIECKMYDTFEILNNYTGKVYSVEKICKEWGIRHNPHDSVSDANACIEIVRHIADAEKISAYDVIMRYGADSVKTTDDYLEQRERTLMKQSLENLTINESTDVTSSEMTGTIVCFTESFEKEYTKVAYNIAKEIIARGGKYSRTLQDCTVLLHNNDIWSRRLFSAFLHPEYNIALMPVDEFLNAKHVKFPVSCYGFNMRSLCEPSNKKVDTMRSLAHDFFCERMSTSKGSLVLAEVSY